MSQNETIRPNEILIDDKLIQEFHETSKEFINGSLSASKQHLCDLIRNNSNNGISPNFGLDDTYEQIRQEFAKFTNDKIIPNAHNWHLNDELILQ